MDDHLYRLVSPHRGYLEPSDGLFLYRRIAFTGQSIFFTRFHLNRKWTLLLEMWVIVHSTIVALECPQNIWSMFFFGFLGIFIITQMHGLNFTTLQKWVFTLLYLAGASVVAIQRGALFYTELPRIALIDYCGIFILAGILWLITKFTPVENSANAKG